MADICIFAGQGAQVPGMGKDFAQDPEIMALFEKANAVLGFDLAKVCFEGPAEELTKSNICQPAIFVTSYAAYTMLQKRRPTAFAAAGGLSLGEWGALCAAGALDFDATLTVLEARGRFMQEACEATPSGMIAIVGASPAQLDELCAKTGCTPFHSKFMQPARDKLAPILDGIEFKAPKIPVLSNVTGQPHSSDPGEIKAVMLRQVTETTRWADDVAAAKALGGTRFVEFGPGKVLSGLIKKIDPALETLNVGDLASLDATVAALG